MVLAKVICAVIIFIPMALFCWESPLVVSILPYLSFLALGLILVFISWYIGKWISDVVLRPFSKTKNKKHLAVLITGCDTGIGHLSALVLNRLGYYVFATCVNLKEDSVKTFLGKAAQPSRMKILQMDITKRAQVIAAIEVVNEVLKNESLVLYGLINNAGIATFGAIEFADVADVSDYETLLQTNVLGAIRVTRAFLPQIRKAKGRVILISSLMARLVTPGSSAYSVSKAALSKFAEGLQLELTQFGVHTISIEPWLARTSMFTPEVITKVMKATASAASAEVKASYGKEYFFQLLQFNRLFSQFPISLRNEMVVEAIVDSLSSLEPEAVYRVIPSILSLLIWLTNDLLAWEIIVFIRRVMFWHIFKLIWIARKLSIIKATE